MGVIALGIGFGSPLALAGVIVHVAGHALAKSLGFYAALPLARRAAVDRVARRRAASRAPMPRVGAVAGPLPRRACRPAALAALRLRAPDRPRRHRGRPHGAVAVAVGPARARLPRPRARAHRCASPAGAAAIAAAASAPGARLVALLAVGGVVLLLALAGRRARASRLRRSRMRSCGGSRERAQPCRPTATRSPRRSRAAHGSRALYASRDAGDAGRPRRGLRDPTGRSQIVSVRRARRLASRAIVDLAPAAEWAEREAHDLHGVGFDGHEPLRPLVDHPPELASWTVPVDGRRRLPGRGRADPRRRDRVRPLPLPRRRRSHPAPRRCGCSTSTAASSAPPRARPLDDAIAYAARACGPAPSRTASPTRTPPSSCAACGPTGDVARARTLLLELERLWNHLNDIAAICAGVGLAAGNQRFAALCEEARRLNADARRPSPAVRHASTSAAAASSLDAASRMPRCGDRCATARGHARRAGASSPSTPRSRIA